MFNLITMPSAQIVGAKISGKLDHSDIKQLIEAVEAQLLHFDKIDVYIEVESFHGMTLKAARKHLLHLLPKIGKVRKKAVVSNSKILGTITKLSRKLSSLININVRHFDTNEKDVALEWLEGHSRV